MQIESAQATSAINGYSYDEYLKDISGGTTGGYIRVIEAKLGQKVWGWTKWDLITEADRNWMLRTHFGSRCSGCDKYLSTEADFAKHFILTNPGIYQNLGTCPKRDQI